MTHRAPVAGLRYLLVLMMCVVGCDCAESHTRDTTVDATSDADADAIGDAAVCGAPILYDASLCRLVRGSTGRAVQAGDRF